MTTVPPARPPRLLLGLGNSLMGDDGVAWHVVEALRDDARLPPEVEVAWGGSDLLACADLLGGRDRVVLLDAVLGEAPGAVVLLDPERETLDERDAGAHGLSLPGALRLLRQGGALDRAEIRLVGIGVDEVRVGTALSAALAARLPAIVAQVLELA